MKLKRFTHNKHIYLHHSTDEYGRVIIERLFYDSHLNVWFRQYATIAKPRAKYLTKDHIINAFLDNDLRAAKAEVDPGYPDYLIAYADAWERVAVMKDFLVCSYVQNL